MPAGFGFSVGDFVAALKIVSQVIDALRDSGDASTECRQLLRHLLDLETALIHVRRLEVDQTQTDQLNALKQAAARCRSTIDEFMTKIQKYQPYLQPTGSTASSTLKQSWYKVKWALCRKEDVERFKADIVGHTEAINILMNSIQIQRMTINAKTQDSQHLTLKTIIKDCFRNTMQKLSIISDLLSQTVSNSTKLLEITARTIHMDCSIFGVVLDIQQVIRGTIAPQILRNQPVYFIDAFGIAAPFYLEFIRSHEAFVSVLRCNMEGSDSCLKRMDRHDFVISDVFTKQDIDLSRPWQMVFRPGQHVDMSIKMDDFTTPASTSPSTCPRCTVECLSETDRDIECGKCGLIFRFLGKASDNNSESQVKDGVSVTLDTEQTVSLPDHLKIEGSSSKRKRDDEIAFELTMYRRVRFRQHEAPNQPTQHSPHTENHNASCFEALLAMGAYGRSYGWI